MSALNIARLSTLPEGKEHYAGTSLHPNLGEVANPSSSTTQDISSLALPWLWKYSPRPRTPSPAHDEEMRSTTPPPTYPPPAATEVNPGITATQAKLFRHRSNIHFAALCWFMFTEGWNDGTPGPLLPVMQVYYHVRFGSRSIRRLRIRRFTELQVLNRLDLL